MQYKSSNLWGEAADWESRGDNSSDIARLKRNLAKIRSQELTQRQAEIISLYYDRGMNTVEIAQALGTNKSTVSRTLERGRKRIKKYLQYSL